MKKWMLLMIGSLVISSCNLDSVDYYKIKSYICCYENGPMYLFYHDYWRDEKPYFFLRFTREPDASTLYYAPEIRAENNDIFLEIAARNGDRSYNRKESLSSIFDRRCLAENFRSVQVICTNAAWDSKHPKGSSLNDLVTLKYGSYAPYVRNGYRNETNGLDGISKRLSDLKENDLAMLNPTINFFFDRMPAVPGSYELQVTLLTTEGKERTATCSFVYKEPK